MLVHYFWACATALTQRNLRMLLTYSRYLILSCPKGPVCNYFVWEIKHDWVKSVVKATTDEQKKGVEKINFLQIILEKYTA